MNKDLKNSVSNLASKEDLVSTKTDIIKWFVGLFIAFAIMIIGLYFK